MAFLALGLKVGLAARLVFLGLGAAKAGAIIGRRFRRRLPLACLLDAAQVDDFRHLNYS